MYLNIIMPTRLSRLSHPVTILGTSDYRVPTSSASVIVAQALHAMLDIAATESLTQDASLASLRQMLLSTTLEALTSQCFLHTVYIITLCRIRVLCILFNGETCEPQHHSLLCTVNTSQHTHSDDS